MTGAAVSLPSIKAGGGWWVGPTRDPLPAGRAEGAVAGCLSRRHVKGPKQKIDPAGWRSHSERDQSSEERESHPLPAARYPLAGRAGEGTIITGTPMWRMMSRFTVPMSRRAFTNTASASTSSA